ncbi:two-component system, OmpR family, phosphate regulon sensor histidine kinase PhoR [Clostridium sp. USBA 49]|uniref:two-component system histidine kinase PnpS n=1 Tax=Clostridium TaxID=1485 RepID=UPI0009991980|nr:MULTISPECIES: ATP-binding protein [Clostridium]SKA76098.1 two-component system, OmpR family, phosphate regulon sensor histidine kinase PhoR [Clostridium sp. USBA 49]
MKKRLVYYILTVLSLSVIVLTIFFIRISNYSFNENLKKQLKNNNDFIISILKSDNIKNKDEFIKNNLKYLNIRITYIDKSGNVIFDSIVDSETMKNHNNRAEIKEARKNGIGYSIRYSSTLNKNMIYVASVFDDGYIVRSSMEASLINNFKSKYIKDYIITLIFVLFIATIMSIRLSQIIVSPIKNLQYIASRLAHGELYKRSKITSNDEIGELSKAFNDMADKLQILLKDVTDKQNRLEAILKSMDSGVIAIDVNYKIIMINPYAKEIFGINKDVIGENLLDVIDEYNFENIFKYNLEEYKEIKITWPKERELRIKTADIISEHKLIGTVAVVQDITDIKKLENMRSQFVANVSHELKTPLTSIKGFAETLKYVEDSDTRDKFLDIINDEAERLTRLINDILILSHIEQHREGKLEEFNINEVIEEVYNLMKNIAESKGVNIKIVGENLPTIVGDRDRFKQMIINLVDNGIKYSEKNDKVFIGTELKNNNYIIWVEDTGVGMSKEHLNRIFERFYRIDKARSRSQGGTGLGLAIVKHIVLSFNGNIEVESQLGVGTKFTIYIPLKR